MASATALPRTPASLELTWTIAEIVKCGEIAPQAQAIVDTLASYSEVSPSQKKKMGIKIVVRALVEGGSKVDHDKGIEIYAGRGRYFTITGHRLYGSPLTIEEHTVELAEVISEHFGPRLQPNVTTPRSTNFPPPTLEQIKSPGCAAATVLRRDGNVDRHWPRNPSCRQLRRRPRGLGRLVAELAKV